MEARISPDQSEQWLNWVIRLNSGEAIGYVQASVFAANGAALIAYELNSAFWGRDLARLAVELMLNELAQHYGVEHFLAQLKQTNARSRRLLERLGFAPTSAEAWPQFEAAADEMLMHRMPAEYSPDFKC
nr:GNAT family N-acetyltransferase [Paucibacter sp. KBW04]